MYQCRNFPMPLVFDHVLVAFTLPPPTPWSGYGVQYHTGFKGMWKGTVTSVSWTFGSAPRDRISSVIPRWKVAEAVCSAVCPCNTQA